VAGQATWPAAKQDTWNGAMALPTTAAELPRVAMALVAPIRDRRAENDGADRSFTELELNRRADILATSRRITVLLRGQGSVSSLPLSFTSLTVIPLEGTPGFFHRALAPFLALSFLLSFQPAKSCSTESAYSPTRRCPPVLMFPPNSRYSELQRTG